MKILALIFTINLLIVVQGRRLQHGLSLSDITNMPIDALQPALSGDFNGAAQKYAMSKIGLSQSRTIGSYFGQEQPKTPLSGLSSFFGGNNNNNANANGGLGALLGGAQGNQQNLPQNQNQGGFSDLLSKFTGGNNQNQIPQNTQQQQGGLSGLLSRFTGGNQAQAQPQPTQQPQSQGGFSDLLNGFLNKNQNAGTSGQSGNNLLGRLFG